MTRPLLEVADIFREHGAAWRRANAGHVSLGQLKAMSAIERCRTAALGGHVARCEGCAHTVVSFNSCRSRSCPKCQGSAARKWLAEREAELLDTGYFHLVFTLPAGVADIAWQNKEVVYGILFKAAAETVLTIAADPRHLGARVGITAVLHTWGSAMTHHPHIHMIVPGGGLSTDGTRWVSCRPGFFLPVRRAFAVFVKRQRRVEWVTYAKAPFAGPKQVLAYLARYTHRMALSNQRLIRADVASVTFTVKNYRVKGPGRYTTMTLATHEFIRRFLMHVPPKGFHRIRHYGLLANGNRAAAIAKARALLAMPPREEKPQAAPTAETAEPPPLPCCCPRCGGRMIITMVFVHSWTPGPRAPPAPIVRLDTS